MAAKAAKPRGRTPNRLLSSNMEVFSDESLAEP